jgi:hypothetical protein
MEHAFECPDSIVSCMPVTVRPARLLETSKVVYNNNTIKSRVVTLRSGQG